MLTVQSQYCYFSLTRLPNSTGSNYGVPLSLCPQEYLQHLDLILLQAQDLSLGNFIPDSTPQGNYLHGTPPLLHSCEAGPIAVTTPALPSSSGKVRSFQHHWMGEMPRVQHSLLSASLANQCWKKHSTECVQTRTPQ